MKNIIALSCLLLSSLAFADNNDDTHRPASFTHAGKKAVFVDFSRADYHITYNITNKSAAVRAIMKFQMPEAGQPIFDLLNDPTSITLDGKAVSAPVVRTPNRETSVRVIAQELTGGEHTLEIQVPLTELLDFQPGSVKSAFWVTDLRDRFYLERYIPTNLEYDRFQQTFHVKYIGLTGRQHIFTNGETRWNGDDQATVVFPAHFTVNSVYFHTTPVGAVETLAFDFTSVDNRKIPVIIYRAPGERRPITQWKDSTIAIMRELESDYGAFPHASMTIHSADLSSMGLGGMEYAGATATSLDALGHELFHSWFGRAVVPANGNAGWIDEALASWRDNGYNRSRGLFGSARMAGQAEYTRSTDTAAYSFGARFMAYMDGKLEDKGGLKAFMRELLANKLFTPIFTSEFISEMEAFAGRDVESEFIRYTGHGSRKNSARTEDHGHPIHKKAGPEEWRKIL